MNSGHGISFQKREAAQIKRDDSLDLGTMELEREKRAD
jgi:hypothetical protein